MANSYFQFKQFTIHHDRCAMKTTTDACLFGAWAAIELQKKILENKQEADLAPKVLDIGSGSGLLSLMLSQKNAVAIDAVEIEPDAAQQARENIQASQWRDRIEVFNEDIVSFEGSGYDYIITNPPFYENELSSSRPEKNLAHHSAALSLMTLVNTIKEKLKSTGTFFILFPFKRAEELEKTLGLNGLFIQKRIQVRQSVNHAPFRVMIMGSAAAPPRVEHDQIDIAGARTEYTPAFTDLLKDYYLY
ncbi:MAG TPA: methyltransferase, partial [Flavisolibacter sp.]|nr:methyltransferase [Flavisolibacter sp.]